MNSKIPVAASIIVLSLLVLGYVEFSYFPPTSASRTSSPSTASTTLSSSLTGTGNSYSSSHAGGNTSCFFMGMPIGVAVHVISDSSGSPLGGVTFNGANVGNQCGNSTISPITTNSSGWGSLPGNPGSYDLSFSYLGHEYPDINIPMYPVTLTEVTLQLPSGIFSVDVLEYGGGQSFVGPTSSASYGKLTLNVTLGSSTVRTDQFLPIRVAFMGPGAWNASYVPITLIVTNASGTLVFNATQRAPSLYSMAYSSALQGLITYNGWNARPYPLPDGVPIALGNYEVTIEAEVVGHLFVAQTSFRVVP